MPSYTTVGLALAASPPGDATWVEWLPAITAFLQLLAVLIPTLVALWGLDSWWREARGRRAMELAEEVLVAVYEAQAAISSLRRPFATTSVAIPRYSAGCSG